MLQGFPAFITSGTMFEEEAQRFIDIVGLTDSTHKTAINNLVRAAKTNGWWSECVAIYPFLGGTASAHKYNIKNMYDTDDAFRLVFTGSWTHSANGIQGDGSTTHANTFVRPSTHLASGDSHVSIYSRTNVGEIKVDIGGYSDASFLQAIHIYSRYNDNFLYADHYQYTTSRISQANTDSRGFFLSTRTDSTTFKVFKNDAQFGSTNNGAQGTMPSNAMYIGAGNTNTGAATNRSTRQYAFATLGYGISDALAALMYTDIQAFQTTLGRQV